MNDNQIIELFLPIISAGLTARGYSNVSVVAANQPTQQGINTSGTVYFYKVSNKRYGYLSTIDEWDSNNDTMVHTEIQPFESVYQVSGLVLQDPTDTSKPTASDLVNEVAWILQSQNTITTLMNSDVGILRISEIRNPYFTDDRDQFEANPSFDFTLTYRDVRVSTAPIITLPVQFDLQAI